MRDIRKGNQPNIVASCLGHACFFLTEHESRGLLVM